MDNTVARPMCSQTLNRYRETDTEAAQSAALSAKEQMCWWAIKIEQKAIIDVQTEVAIVLHLPKGTIGNSTVRACVRSADKKIAARIALMEMEGPERTEIAIASGADVRNAPNKCLKIAISGYERSKLLELVRNERAAA